MTWKKIILTTLNIASELFGSGKSTKKVESNEYDFLFDEAYYAGTMSYGESQDWKRYWSPKNSE